MAGELRSEGIDNPDGMMREFDCCDCGAHVYAFGLLEVPRPPRCSTCAFLRTIQGSMARHEARAAVYDREAMQYWVEVGSFRDEDYAERACDLCGTLYRGPAVYCSLKCAQ